MNIIARILSPGSIIEPGLDGPPAGGSEGFVTPSDTVDLPRKPTRGLWIGEDGDVVCDMYDGSQSVPFPGVKAGSVIPGLFTRVRATGTSITKITALY